MREPTSTLSVSAAELRQFSTYSMARRSRVPRDTVAFANSASSCIIGLAICFTSRRAIM